jgi:choline dehydrogenase-like flavoprotein
MRFVVYGAGAIGGVIAARLFQAGPVMLITRGAPAHRGTGQRRRIVLAESDTAGGQHRDRLSQWRDRAPGATHWRPHSGERAALPACQSDGAARQPTGARGARRCAGPVRPNCLYTLVTIQALKPRLGNALQSDRLLLKCLIMSSAPTLRQATRKPRNFLDSLATNSGRRLWSIAQDHQLTEVWSEIRSHVKNSKVLSSRHLCLPHSGGSL